MLQKHDKLGAALASSLPLHQARSATARPRATGLLRSLYTVRSAIRNPRLWGRSWLKYLTRRRRWHQGEALRLHIGCGPQRLEGWCNIDALPFPSVDYCLDVTLGLPFHDVGHIFAEHFLEHLDLIDTLDFLHACQACLNDGGRIRLSTPNLDWVWTHLYSCEGSKARCAQALQLNRSFYGWQHRFLWNRELLARVLIAAGFAELRWCRYGSSRVEAFRGIERHEVYADTPDLPHVLIVEATRGAHCPFRFADLKAELEYEFARFLENP